jgi:hypothetical protein
VFVVSGKLFQPSLIFEDKARSLKVLPSRVGSAYWRTLENRLTGTNTLAYFAPSSNMKKKGIISKVIISQVIISKLIIIKVVISQVIISKVMISQVIKSRVMIS